MKMKIRMKMKIKKHEESRYKKQKNGNQKIFEKIFLINCNNTEKKFDNKMELNTLKVL